MFLYTLVFLNRESKYDYIYIDQCLDRAAYYRALEIDVHGYNSHYTEGGDAKIGTLVLNERMRDECGYKGWIAENVAHGYYRSYAPYRDDLVLANAIIKDSMLSESHRRNILWDGHTSIGIGCSGDVCVFLFGQKEHKKEYGTPFDREYPYLVHKELDVTTFYNTKNKIVKEYDNSHMTVNGQEVKSAKVSRLRIKENTISTAEKF